MFFDFLLVLGCLFFGWIEGSWGLFLFDVFVF